MEKTVAAELSSKGRYFSTLPQVLIAIAMQNRVPDELHIFDDNLEKDRVDLRQVELYKDIFSLIQSKGIQWFVHFGKGIGQVPNHNDALTKTECDYIWRLDDDNYPEPNVLEVLLKAFDDPLVGASSCKIWKPSNPMGAKSAYVQNKIVPGLTHTPAEWFEFSEFIDSAEHLYSTYLFDRKVAIAAGGYPDYLSPVGHREESIFSHRIYRAGYKLVISPDAITWHYHNPEGGIRSYSDTKLWHMDEEQFQNQLKEWGYLSKKELKICLDNGIGDHYIFKMILPEIKEKYPDYKLVIAVCYPDIFEDVLDKYDMDMISIADGKKLFVDIDRFNVYKMMDDTKWQGSLKDAFRKMYV